MKESNKDEKKVHRNAKTEEKQKRRLMDDYNHQSSDINTPCHFKGRVNGIFLKT